MHTFDCTIHNTLQTTCVALDLTKPQIAIGVKIKIQNIYNKTYIIREHAQAESPAADKPLHKLETCPS